MIYIKFRYKDDFTEGKWVEKEYTGPSLEDCKDQYGLDYDYECKYEIIEMKKIEEN